MPAHRDFNVILPPGGVRFDPIEADPHQNVRALLFE
jgi:hypothetical protein